MFTLAWIGNRLTQSIGWAGLIKVSSKWFDYSSYGTIIGILSISYLVGDALARQQMGMLIAHGYGWRALFVFAAVVAGLALLANLLFLRESRLDEGHPEATPNPLNLFAATESAPAGIRALLLPLLRSRAFLLVCLLSFACTIIRETFNTWNPDYLHDLGFSMSRSATLSAIFPAVGAVSVLVAGWLSDQLGLSGRSLLLFSGLAATAAALTVLAFVHPGRQRHRRCRCSPSVSWPSACSGPTPTSAAPSRWISAASRPAPPPRASSTASATWAACSPVTAWRAWPARWAGSGCSWRWRWSARRRRCAPRACMYSMFGRQGWLMKSHDITGVSCAPDRLTVEWADGARSEFASLWLRDNRPEDRDLHSGQRLIDITDLPENPLLRSATIEDGAVRVEWQGPSRRRRSSAPSGWPPRLRPSAAALRSCRCAPGSRAARWMPP